MSAGLLGLRPLPRVKDNAMVRVLIDGKVLRADFEQTFLTEAVRRARNAPPAAANQLNRYHVSCLERGSGVGSLNVESQSISFRRRLMFQIQNSRNSPSWVAIQLNRCMRT